MSFKRGEFSAEIVSIVIAAIGIIIILGVAGVILYSNFTEEQRAAKKTIESIVGKIKNLKDGETGRFAVQGFKNSENWYLVGFDSRDSLDDKPGRCAFESCICICDFNNEGIQLPASRQVLVDSCQNNGFCRFFDNKDVLIKDSSLKISGGIPYKKCISLRESLQELIVLKNETKIIITKGYDISSPSISDEGDYFHFEECYHGAWDAAS